MSDNVTTESAPERSRAEEIRSAASAVGAAAMEAAGGGGGLPDGREGQGAAMTCSIFWHFSTDCFRNDKSQIENE